MDFVAGEPLGRRAIEILRDHYEVGATPLSASRDRAPLLHGQIRPKLLPLKAAGN